jgi:hypothetical protein
VLLGCSGNVERAFFFVVLYSWDLCHGTLTVGVVYILVVLHNEHTFMILCSSLLFPISSVAHEKVYFLKFALCCLIFLQVLFY